MLAAAIAETDKKKKKCAQRVQMSVGKQIKNGVNEWIGRVRVMRKGYAKVTTHTHTRECSFSAS